MEYHLKDTIILKSTKVTMPGSLKKEVKAWDVDLVADTVKYLWSRSINIRIDYESDICKWVM